MSTFLTCPHFLTNQTPVEKQPVIRIKDLAEVMIRELAPRYGYAAEDIAVQMIGSKPGEKLYEELMTQEETRRTIELPNYFAVTPAFASLYKDVSYQYPEVINRQVENPYNSANENADPGRAQRLFVCQPAIGR